MFQWSAVEIHLPQLLNEEANADEFSNWEQVSSTAAERFVPWPPASPALSSSLPSPLIKKEGQRHRFSRHPRPSMLNIKQDKPHSPYPQP